MSIRLSKKARLARSDDRRRHAEGRLLHDVELKDELANSRDFRDWIGKVIDLDESIQVAEEPRVFEAGDLRRARLRRVTRLRNWNRSSTLWLKMQKKPLASMGDDTPQRVLSDKYRPLSHFFRQNFSQVTNPPIDSLREHRVMSLKTRFGNLKNVLDRVVQPDRDLAHWKARSRQMRSSMRCVRRSRLKSRKSTAPSLQTAR